MHLFCEKAVWYHLHRQLCMILVHEMRVRQSWNRCILFHRRVCVCQFFGLVVSHQEQLYGTQMFTHICFPHVTCIGNSTKTVKSNKQHVTIVINQLQGGFGDVVYIVFRIHVWLFCINIMFNCLKILPLPSWVVDNCLSSRHESFPFVPSSNRCLFWGLKGKLKQMRLLALSCF